MSTQSRRKFIQNSAATTAVAALAAMESKATPASIPIVDTHQHLWDMKQFSPPWLKDPSSAKIAKPSNFAEYLEATRGLNVIKTVYMEVDVAERQQQEEADWVNKICMSKASLMKAGVVAGRPANPNFAKYASQFKGSKTIKGIRQVLQVPEAKRGLCLTDSYVKSIQLLGELGLTFDICIRPEELSDAAKLVDKCPHTRFILDHCGNASARNPHQKQWETDITALAKRKNVVCKVSGIIKTVHSDWSPEKELAHIIHFVCDSFGPDRVMFGGDWPVCNFTFDFKTWVQTLNAVLSKASETDKRKLFGDNAIKFYGLA